MYATCVCVCVRVWRPVSRLCIVVCKYLCMRYTMETRLLGVFFLRCRVFFACLCAHFNFFCLSLSWAGSSLQIFSGEFACVCVCVSACARARAAVCVRVYWLVLETMKKVFRAKSIAKFIIQNEWHVWCPQSVALPQLPAMNGCGGKNYLLPVIRLQVVCSHRPKLANERASSSSSTSHSTNNKNNNQLSRRINDAQTTEYTKLSCVEQNSRHLNYTTDMINIGAGILPIGIHTRQNEMKKCRFWAPRCSPIGGGLQLAESIGNAFESVAKFGRAMAIQRAAHSTKNAHNSCGMNMTIGEKCIYVCAYNNNKNGFLLFRTKFFVLLCRNEIGNCVRACV